MSEKPAEKRRRLRAERIQELLDKGLTRRDVAARLGLHPTTVGRDVKRMEQEKEANQ